MERHRIRLRFRKEGELRFISHRDLVRVFERIFRRAGFELSMTEGFHAKARLSFPLALSLGIEGAEEIMEVELQQPIAPEEIGRRLSDQSVAGLVIDQVIPMPPGSPKPRVRSVVYEILVPTDRHRSLVELIEQRTNQSEWPVERIGKNQTIDVLPQLASLGLVDRKLRIEQRIHSEASFNPRDLLRDLEMDDLEEQGLVLRRQQVELKDSKFEDSELRDSESEDNESEDNESEDSKFEDSESEDSELRDSELRDSELRDSELRDSELRDSELRDSKH